MAPAHGADHTTFAGTAATEQALNLQREAGRPGDVRLPPVRASA